MKLDKTNIPKHIAIVMDGNRRWAKQQGLEAMAGHEKGAERLEQIVDAATKMGVKTITVYALSTENIKERAKREVLGLFNLMIKGYQTRLRKMMSEGVRVAILGESGGLPGAITHILDQIKKTYIKNESITLNIALNYGSKKELIQAIKGIVKKGIDVERINEELVEKHLYTKGQHNPELVIRTGGRMRLSNFLLWQTAYSEFYFTRILWPDFTPVEFEKAIMWYQEQQRNFGK